MRLFVIEPRSSGGMIHYAYQLCTALANHGAVVTLVTAQDYEMAAYPHNFTVEKWLNLWSHHLDPQSMQPPRTPLGRAWRKAYRSIRRGTRAVRFIYQWLRLIGYLLAQKPDLVQFGSLNFPFEALFLAFLRRRGLTLTQICHEFEMRERGGGPISALSNWLYAGVNANFSAIFLHAESNRQRFLALYDVPLERTHIIPHGNENLFPASANGTKLATDLRQRYGLDPYDPVILFFGTLAPSKGLTDLLEAFAIVRRHSRARLLIAGFPSKHISLPELQHLAAELGIAAATIFDPRYLPIEEVGPLMQLAGLVVYPYRSSTQSGALQVAYAFGRPVVATRVGGLPEAVEDGRSGFLVPPENPVILAEAILKIANNPPLGEEMGAYARHLSETRYSWGPIAGQILAVYQRLLAEQVPPLGRSQAPAAVYVEEAK